MRVSGVRACMCCVVLCCVYVCVRVCVLLACECVCVCVCVFCVVSERVCCGVTVCTQTLINSNKGGEGGQLSEQYITGIGKPEEKANCETREL